jgi:transposase
MSAAFELLDHARGRAFIGDTGYDSQPLEREAKQRGLKFVVCSHPTRARRRRFDRKLYRQRYLVEIFFHTLKRFRAIATRYDKTARNFLALIQLACVWLWLN